MNKKNIYSNELKHERNILLMNMAKEKTHFDKTKDKGWGFGNPVFR